MKRAAALVLMAVMMAVAVGCYGQFVAHVLARGASVIHEKWSSQPARLPLLFAGGGLAASAASGIVGLLAGRGRRWAPLAGLGIPFASAGAIGLLAFEAGPGVFGAAAWVAGCFVAAAAAAVAFGDACGAAWRAGLAAWMTVGTLLSLALMAFGALGVLETKLVRIPWSAILAAIALAALMRGMSRHVAATGQDPTGTARPHQQVRNGLDTEPIREVAGRLHPFIEEGRGGEEYDRLMADLAARVGAEAPGRFPALEGPRLPAAPAALAALLRAAAFAAPLAFLVPGLWAVAVPLLLAGLLLPASAAALVARREPLRAPWWLGAAALAGAGGALAAFLAVGGRWAAAGAAVGIPYALLALRARGRTRPEDIAFLRATQARALLDRRAVQTAQGVLVAASFAVLPPVLLGLPYLIGVDLPMVPLPIVAGGVLGGLCWALGAVVAGRTVKRSINALDAAHATMEKGRRAAHSRFLEQLEAL
ncbi:MAG TPA: hypothetical protein VM286_00290 [Candidatus Thermoplasmatota archaeon]|nr:hypothetical protein [Candidatus Thermoplasmatota archaeon]